MKKRVLIAKLGLDGHDRGLHMIAIELRGRGAEVVMLGVGTTPDEVVQVAVQEDVDIVGISILSGAHLVLIPKLMSRMRQVGLQNVAVLCGGTIPAGDIPELTRQGVSGVFPVGTSVAEAADALIREGATATR